MLNTLIQSSSIIDINHIMPLTYIKTIIALIKVSKNSMNRKKNIL